MLTNHYRPDENTDPEADLTTFDRFEKLRAEMFTLLMLLSWIYVLSFLRIFRDLRCLIAMIMACTRVCFLFVIILFIMMFGFTFANYYRVHMISPDTDEEIKLFERMYDTFLTAFGDFGATDHLDGALIPYAIFFVAVFFILIVMMNLLIGIIGDELAKIMEN